MTANEFREKPEFVAELRPILEMPIMKLWLDCVLRSSPSNVATVPADISATVANIELGSSKGFHLHHNIFVSGGTNLVPRKSKDTAAMALEPEPGLE